MIIFPAAKTNQSMLLPKRLPQEGEKGGAGRRTWQDVTKFLVNWRFTSHIAASVVSFSRALSSDLLCPIMRILLFVVFMLSCSGLYARYPVFKATRLTLQDGLSDDMVLCALQDKRGFMWFGTRNGLNRYDGYRITTFTRDQNDPYSLSDASVHSLCEDRHGRMWVGTADGLNLFDPVSERFTHYRYAAHNPSGILPGVLISICEDRFGCLWLVTNNTRRGIQKLDPEHGVFTTYRHNPEDPYSISDDGMTGICVDKSGELWIATRSGGLNRYDHAHDRFINLNTAPEYRFVADKRLIRVFAASDGGLWLAERTTNVWKVHINGKHLKAELLQLDRRPNFYDNTVISITEGIGGTLWVGTEGGGFYTVDIQSRRFNQVTNTADIYGLASNQVFMLYGDNYGDMWICTDMGVERFHRRTNYIRHFSRSALESIAPSYQKIRSLLLVDNRLLVGTGGYGLNVSKGDEFHHYLNPDHSTSLFSVDILSNTLNVLYRLRDGTLLTGTNNGLYKVDPATGKFSRFPYQIFGPRVWAICEGKDGVLWIGTLFNGLTRIDRRTGKVEYYFAGQSAQQSGTPISVHEVHEDQHGNLWIGTNNGLYRMDRVANRPVQSAWNSSDSFSLSHNHIWYIHERDGKLWLGTSGGGMNLFDPATGRCKRYGKKEGLPSDIICGMLEDRRGNIWASTNTGLFRFSPSTGKVVTFGVDDGVYISDFHFKACFRDTNGVMYFGGTGGYLCFHPDSMSIKTRPRRLIFTSFKVFDRKLALDTALLFKKQMILPYSSNYFSVEFASLDFAGVHHHQYRYKLDRYDRQWRHTDGTHPLAGYTDVPPGNYKLFVEVADAEGNWGGARATLGISITPAWWQVWWFQMAVLLCLVAIGVSLLRWYLGSMRRKGAMERRLVELQLHALRAQMNPHFIFNSLNSIYYYILNSENEKAQTYLGLFSVLLRQILEYSRRTFISISREIEILDLYLQLEAMRFSQRFGYKMSIAPDIDIERQFIPTMLLQPYVENAVKHGLLPKEKDCLLTIEFQRRGDRIVCSITDNGIGRKMAGQIREQSQLPYTSQGLALSKERMTNLSELHGKLYGVEVQDLTTDTGEALGTRIVLTFPADVDEESVGVLPHVV